MTQAVVLGLLAETFIHPCCGQMTGAIDLPVMREAATDYPFIPGSSFKGALRDKAKQDPEIKLNMVFGEQENAGNLLVSDVRLLLLPVRSLTGSYKWVTCPHLLERLKRDLDRAWPQTKTPWAIPSVEVKHALSEGTSTLYLEERSFQVSGKPDDSLVTHLEKFIEHADTKNRLSTQLVVLNDKDFAWFARYGLAVHARNVLDENKASGNLWYEEALPPDTLMYSLLSERNGSSNGTIKKLLPTPYLQIGGNETIGQGWFAVKILDSRSLTS